MREDEFLEDFFEFSFERTISEEMLERDYVFPRSNMEDYILQMTSIPYKNYIDYICTHYYGAEIDNANIPQFSNFDDGTINICKVMKDLGDPGLGYVELGQALLSDGVERKIGAYQKYGENHVKCASFHGLTYVLYKSWFLTCLGYIFPDLDEELRQYVVSRTLLRNPLFRLVVSEAVNKDVNIKKYLGGLSASTQVRRSSSCIHLFNIILRQCEIEGIRLHKIFFSSDQNGVKLIDIGTLDPDIFSLRNDQSNGLHKSSHEFIKLQFCGLTQKEEPTDIEVNRLLKNYREGDLSAQKQIIYHHLSLVAEIAHNYCRSSEFLDDFIQEGCLGLIQAINRFDNLKSSRFDYYARFWIAQYIISALNTWAYAVRIPQNQILIYQKIRSFKEKYEQRYGHRPAFTDIEINEDISEDRLAYLDKLPTSLNEMTEFHEDMDYLEGEFSFVEDFEIDEYNRYYVNKLLSILSPRDRALIESYFGLGDYRGQENSLEEVGLRFGLTRERARQIVEKSRRDLRERAKIVREPYRMVLTPGINKYPNKDSDTLRVLIKSESAKAPETPKPYKDKERRTRNLGGASLVERFSAAKKAVAEEDMSYMERRRQIELQREIEERKRRRQQLEVDKLEEQVRQMRQKKREEIEEKQEYQRIHKLKHKKENFDIVAADKKDVESEIEKFDLKVGDTIYYNSRYGVVRSIFKIGEFTKLIIEYLSGRRDYVTYDKSKIFKSSLPLEATHRSNHERRTDSTSFSLSSTLLYLVELGIITRKQLRQCHRRHLYTIGDVKRIIERYNLTPDSTRFTQYTLDMWFSIVNLIMPVDKPSLSEP